MDGRPVWLASVARRDRASGEIIPTGLWTARPGLRNKGLAILRAVLEGIGDRRFERVFRMNATLCMHRAMTAEEVEGLPEWWHSCPSQGEAGPAVEVIYSRGASGRPAQQPCENPVRTIPWAGYPESLWIPEDCGLCEPCLDRSRVRTEERT